MQHLVEAEGQAGYARRSQWMGPCAAVVCHGCVCERSSNQAFPSLQNRYTSLACLGRRLKRLVRTCRALILLRPWHWRQSGQQALAGVVSRAIVLRSPSSKLIRENFASACALACACSPQECGLVLDRRGLEGGIATRVGVCALHLLRRGSGCVWHRPRPSGEQSCSRC